MELGAFSENDFMNDEMNSVMKKLDDRVWKKAVEKLRSERNFKDNYALADIGEVIHLTPHNAELVDRDYMSVSRTGTMVGLKRLYLDEIDILHEEGAVDLKVVERVKEHIQNSKINMRTKQRKSDLKFEMRRWIDFKPKRRKMAP